MGSTQREVDKGLDRDPVLLILAGENHGRIFPVKGQTRIGRSRDADLCFHSDQVSRIHARICHNPQAPGWWLEDLNSRHGCRVNGVPVEQHALSFGDRISIGGSILLLFTNRDGLEERFAQSQKMESLGRLAGGIAHDFNNLLGTVIANLTFVGDLSSDTSVRAEPAAGALSDALKAASHAAKLTKQLLGFARSGRNALEPVRLDHLIEEATRMVERAAKRMGDLELELAPDIWVYADATELHQVLTNLFLNAFDAQPDGQIRVVLRPVDRADERYFDYALPTGQAVIEVHDSGSGMSADVQRRALEPFFTTKPAGRGTGLGLSLVYGIVKTYGGELHLDSEVGRGTCVRLMLPLRESSEDLDLQTSDTEDQTPDGLRVLVLDDDAMMRAAAVRLLEHLGCTVYETACGQQALEVLEKHDVDVVLLDMVIPGTDVEATFRAMMSKAASPRVLLMSGYAESERSDALLAGGALGFLAKPYDLETLQTSLVATMTP